MKDAYYFSHDSNARNDPKIAAMMGKYGFQGYGWYWTIIETLRDQSNYKYPMTKYSMDAIAKLLQCERIMVVEFISDCCHEFVNDESGLLCMDDKNLWSESLLRRMVVVDCKREKAVKSANKRWEDERNANAMPSHSEGNAIKEKKIKEKKNNNTNEVEEFYEKVWSLYPKKEGKAAVKFTQKKKLFDIGYDKIKISIDRYCKAKQNTDKQWWAHGSTFFNTAYVDFLPTEEQMKPQKVFERIYITAERPPDKEIIDDSKIPF